MAILSKKSNESNIKLLKLFSIGGFTLAEVLITIGIIGIVASMIIPSLFVKIRAYTLKNQFQKSFSELSRALINTKVDLGVENLQSAYVNWNGTVYVNSGEFRDAFYRQLKISGIKNYPSPPRNFTNTTNAYFSAIGNENPRNALPDGTTVECYIWSSSINITVDINGPLKKPNRVGYDIFAFYVGPKDTLLPRKRTKIYTQAELDALPEGTISGHLGLPCSVSSVSQAGNGLGCAYYALVDKNPDDDKKGYWESLSFD